MKKLILLIAAALLLTACGEVELTQIYENDDYEFVVRAPENWWLGEWLDAGNEQIQGCIHEEKLMLEDGGPSCIGAAMTITIAPTFESADNSLVNRVKAYGGKIQKEDEEAKVNFIDAHMVMYQVTFQGPKYYLYAVDMGDYGILFALNDESQFDLLYDIMNTLR